ncbi:ATP-binding protein [Citrobacter sp. Awk 4]|uniref:AAA family ATPase n=1 Tax=Enterobacteriaceae TaxID=543 RepID=UPI002302ED5E|nr:AAA family ATPase [Citrobacter sp. Awk 4]MDA8478108.1 ATP-binding protein [Citrobacter sp. Awk 4]
MQLRYISIPQFRNLRNLEVNFASKLDPMEGGASDAELKHIRSHALIGQNGMGKSNFIEALITLFRDVDLDRDAGFDYALEYEIRGQVVRIHADTAKQKRPYVWVNEISESQGYLLRNRELLPSHIFAYYSGRNERIEQLFQEHQRRFTLRQEITTDEVLSERLLENFSASDADIRALEEAKRRRDLRLKQAGDDRLRRLFYCRGGHSQLVLLACLLSDDPIFQKVLKNLHIESLESAIFVLKEPHRLREKRRNSKFDETELNEGDPRFWYARGNVVSEFLDKLWQVAWAPIEQEASKQIDFRGRTEKQRQLYLFVPNKEKLKQLGELVGGPDSFFRYAEGAYIGDLIEEVRIVVKKSDEHGGKVSFTNLSEGELQMLTVLGLMRITRDDHCLFLLDEPDTHLNPLWKLRYFEDIESVLSSEKGSVAQGESQILITTHDPMMIGSLRKEQVHIIRNIDGRTLVEQPDEHPQGMGVSGLLKSEMFGLPSTLDHHTLNTLQRRNDLLAKRKHEGLNQNEQQELDHLVVRLDDLGFSREYRDPMYQLFIEQMYKVRRKPLDELLSDDELKEQNAVAEKIMEQLVKAQRMDDLSSLAQELAERLKR